MGRQKRKLTQCRPFIYFFFKFCSNSGKMMKLILLLLVVATVFAKPKGSIKLADADAADVVQKETEATEQPKTCKDLEGASLCGYMKNNMGGCNGIFEQFMIEGCAKTCVICTEEDIPL